MAPSRQPCRALLSERRGAAPRAQPCGHAQLPLNLGSLKTPHPVSLSLAPGPLPVPLTELRGATHTPRHPFSKHSGTPRGGCLKRLRMGWKRRQVGRGHHKRPGVLASAQAVQPWVSEGLTRLGSGAGTVTTPQGVLGRRPHRHTAELLAQQRAALGDGAQEGPSLPPDPARRSLPGCWAGVQGKTRGPGPRSLPRITPVEHQSPWGPRVP